MSNSTSHGGAPPTRWVRIVVTVVIVTQFSMILIAVIGGGTERFPSPPPVVEALIHVRCYLQSVFLANPYRFYAPDPGPTELFWYRIEYENGGVRWRDFADRETFWNRMPYQRHSVLTMMPAQMKSAHPTNPREQLMYPAAFILIQSYTRHVAVSQESVTPSGEPNPVREVEAYHLPHGIAEPWMIRLGWDAYDLRLHGAFYLGAFDREGRRIDVEDKEDQMRILQQRISVLAARIIEDLMPDLEGLSGAERLAAFQKLRPPLTIRRLAARHPELLDPTPTGQDLAERIRQVVEARDDPEEKKKVNPLWTIDW
jgi:hypothetical protein